VTQPLILITHHVALVLINMSQYQSHMMCAGFTWLRFLQMH